jgi:hypothetical protein
MAGLAAVLVCLAACSPGPSSVYAPHSPSPSSSPPVVAQASPSPSPPPALAVACPGGAASGAVVLLQGTYPQQQMLYDVSDPVHPRLLCIFTNTSAHLVTGTTVEWLKPISDSETDIVLHALGANDTLVGTFPFRVTSGAWLPDGSVMAYTAQLPPDNTTFPAGGIAVYLYAQQRTGLLFTYPISPTDCICRFGLQPQVLAVSPDGQYLVAGWVAGKGAQPLAIYRVSDRSRVATLDFTVDGAFWDRTGHRLFLHRFDGFEPQAWTPSGGVVDLAGASAWSFLPGLSPDGGEVAYTDYSDPNVMAQPRPYVYDLKAGTTRMLINQLRTQVLFVKDGWVWYLEDRACTPGDACAGSTMPTGKVFAMQLAAGTETEVTFAAGENPVAQAGGVNWLPFGPGEFWPAT